MSRRETHKMSDVDDRFAQATDSLVALYRNVERRTLDLPLFSIMPMLIYFWAVMKFVFFFYIGILLIVPTNIVILIRNLLFPGRWRYRPFFLPHLKYAWLWVWRGEAPFAPSIFVRPLFTVFMKAHFERRLRRLRLEIALHDQLSDATRSTLLSRLDAMLERWKSPRFATIFVSLLLPGIASLPTWYKQFTDFFRASGIHVPVDEIVNVVSQHVSGTGLRQIGLISFGYLLAIPLTAFLAKRGLFIGGKSNDIYFPGGQEGCGFYLQERQILDQIGLRAREMPIDFWILGFVSLPLMVLTLLTMDYWMPVQDFSGSNIPAELQLKVIETVKNATMIMNIVGAGIFLALFSVAAARRAKLGRS
jgi:hypothetical protein